jgi:hypothetical protein
VPRDELRDEVAKWKEALPEKWKDCVQECLGDWLREWREEVEHTIQTELGETWSARELCETYCLCGSARMKIAGARGLRTPQAWEAEFGVPIPAIIREWHEFVIEDLALQYALAPVVEEEVRRDFGVSAWEEPDTKTQCEIEDEVEARIFEAECRARDAWEQRQLDELCDLIARRVEGGSR